MNRPFKRLVSALILTVLLVPSAFATLYFGKDDSMRLDFAPIVPLYKESLAYPFSNNVRFYYMFAPQEVSSIVNTILVSADDGTGKPTYKELAFKEPSTHNTRFWGLKSCVDLGVMRFTFKQVSAEVYIHGGINTVFGAYGGVDCLGFDGQYGLGVSAKMFDSLAMRFGFHHFSGHWGDEILGDFYHVGYTDSDYKEITEFTRNNSWFFGINYSVLDYFRVGFDAELPMHKAWIRPAAHVPASTIKPSSEESPEAANTSDHIWRQEGFDERDNRHYPASYKAWRLGFSLEARYPVKDVGSVYAAADLQLHQDGKIDIQTTEYRADAPWKAEFTAIAGFAFRDAGIIPEFCIELSYHTGRFPLLNYWFRDIGYFSLGVGLTI
ncbi:MAG: hypothetical protein IJT52_04435 [Spirochaetales bacterium]|nr:hypothetical protein [Spirochaetales bacterium]